VNGKDGSTPAVPGLTANDHVECFAKAPPRSMNDRIAPTSVIQSDLCRSRQRTFARGKRFRVGYASHRPVRFSDMRMASEYTL
jgi:hypothetical protein